MDVHVHVEKRLTLEKLIKIVNAFQLVKNANEQMSQQPTASTSGQNFENVQKVTTAGRQCPACNYSHGTRQPCPAYGKTCGQCGLMNHFRAACRTPRDRWVNEPTDDQGARTSFQMKRPPSRPFDRHSEYGNGSKRFKNSHEGRRIHSIQEDTREDLPAEAIDMVKGDDPEEFIWAKVGGVKIRMQIDSGSQSNIVDERTWNFMVANKVKTERIEKSDKRFRAYAAKEDLETVVMFDAKITIPTDDDVLEEKARFYVIKDGPQPLLGKSTA